MPPGVEKFSLKYAYERHHATREGNFTAQDETNIIDLGLIAPDGAQVGASGSDKKFIEISETGATPGYHACRLLPGEWGILVGAYKVAGTGVAVKYELDFKLKELRLLKGDLHTHTLASDGVQTAWELALRARSNGLDFLAITDHNQMVSSDSLPQVPGMTLIPGIEWTTYKGHATFLGVDRPYDGSFMANTLEEVRSRFVSARERGALITLAHPFDEGCPFTFDLQALPYDMIEVWNGPMRESNLRAIGRWQSLLAAGEKVPICGGSDYHHDGLFIYPGGPTTCVYSMSSGASDILSALRAGHAFITFASDGPMLEMKAGVKMMGDSIIFSDEKEMQIKVHGLQKGDVVQVVTAAGSQPIHKAEAPGSLEMRYPMDAPGFAFMMVLRSFVPGLPLLPALISNPIYFD